MEHTVKKTFILIQEIFYEDILFQELLLVTKLKNINFASTLEYSF